MYGYKSDSSGCLFSAVYLWAADCSSRVLLHLLVASSRLCLSQSFHISSNGSKLILKSKRISDILHLKKMFKKSEALNILIQRPLKKLDKQMPPTFGSSTPWNMYEHKDISNKILETAGSVLDLQRALTHQEHKFHRSISLPTGMASRPKGNKRRWEAGGAADALAAKKTFAKPSLISVSNYQNYFSLVLDNVGCLYPVR